MVKAKLLGYDVLSRRFKRFQKRGLTSSQIAKRISTGRECIVASTTDAMLRCECRKGRGKRGQIRIRSSS